MHTQVISLKDERKRLYQAIRDDLDPILGAKGFRWERPSFWRRDRGWIVDLCSLGVRKVSFVPAPEFIGGAGVLLPAYHDILLPSVGTRDEHGPISTLGGPIHWIDKRLEHGDGRFSSFEEFEQWLPHYRNAFVERVLPEFDRYTSEEVLLDLLVRKDWSDRVLLPATRDRRGGLVVLMIERRGGARRAIEWADAELAAAEASAGKNFRPHYCQETRRARELVLFRLEAE